MSEESPPRGIWYEEKRARWRVKLALNGAIYHRSYHKTYDEAYAVWERIKKEIRNKATAPVHEATAFNRWVCRPLAGAVTVRSTT